MSTSFSPQMLAPPGAKMTQIEAVLMAAHEAMDRAERLQESMSNAGTHATTQVSALNHDLGRLIAELQSASENLVISTNEKVAEAQKRVVTDYETAMADATTEVTHSVTTSLEKMRDASLTAIQTSATQAGAEVERRIKRSMLAVRTIWGMLGAGVAIFVFVLGAVLGSYVTGHFVNTTPSQADRLAELNGVDVMINCRGFKKVQKNNITLCVPIDASGQVVGWRIQ